MLLVARVDSRRVLALGVAGLVPAALVTLLLVHQPSIGARRLYPLLRGSIALLGLCLALATLITWACSPSRRSRGPLCGLAWAGVTGLLCIGPFLESTPRPRLYALELDDGDVLWATTEAAGAPRIVDGELVVGDTESGTLVGLNPRTGEEIWREAVADGRLPATVSENNAEWSRPPPAEDVLAVVEAGESSYAYVRTRGANGAPSGAIVKFDTGNGETLWRRGLPAMAVVTSGSPTIDANGSAVVVAGGEQIAALDADDGHLRWMQSVVALGKSRGYALPGAVQQVIVTDSLVFLSATPDT